MQRPRRSITDAVGSLRSRLERLNGLPLRPSSLPALLAGEDDCSSHSHSSIDPGWSLLSRRDGEAPPELLCWESHDGRVGEAVDRLWRFSVACAIAARRLSRDGGDPNPEAVARVALLQPLGLWALASAEPALLAEWLASDLPADRSRLESDWFGQDLAGFGYHLAHRWACGPELADAALLAGLDSEPPPGLSHDPALLGWVRIARGWAMATPWALPGPRPDPCPSDDDRRWLVAAVQARCSGGLARPAEELDPVAMLRDAVRSALHARRLDRELADLSDRLAAAVEELGRRPGPEPEPGDPTPSRPVLDAMAEFAAGAAHELNNPLAIIAGRAQLLRAQTSDPEHRQALQTMIGQARRAHQMLRDLIYIARPPRPRAIPTVPDQVLHDSVHDLADEAEARGVELVVRTGGGRPLPSSNDPEALRHLADALVRNAIEATPSGGRVVVASVEDPRSIVWQVTDSGIGLDEERAAHLLDPFYCGRSAGRGLGLGLPRVAQYLRSVGGALSWDRVDGGGTRFRVTLPLENGLPEAIPPPGVREVG